MSFASEVKKELTTIKIEPCCFKAELHQMIRLRSDISLVNKDFKISLSTTSLAISRRILFLIKSLYDVNVNLIKKKRSSLDKRALYFLEIENKGFEILTDLDLIDENYMLKKGISSKFLEKECCKMSLLRASFLIKGSINDPKTNNYHLELVLNDEVEALQLQTILSQVGINGKIITRSKGIVLYLKKAEEIGDFLGYIGAMNARFIFEDLRIKKDLANYVNRIINCDVANEQKVLRSAKSQIDDIEKIEKTMGFLNLSPRLMNAIILRTTHPEDSLAQLSEKSEEEIGRYISKSGLSHCFRDLKELAESIKKSSN